jgi:hypothetical protein
MLGWTSYLSRFAQGLELTGQLPWNSILPSQVTNLRQGLLVCSHKPVKSKFKPVSIQSILYVYHIYCINVVYQLPVDPQRSQRNHQSPDVSVCCTTGPLNESTAVHRSSRRTWWSPPQVPHLEDHPTDRKWLVTGVITVITVITHV